eukprot:COSAG05_NODE_37_length_27688_cov_18.080394_15_plen_35_part_00
MPKGVFAPCTVLSIRVAMHEFKAEGKKGVLTGTG